MGDDTYPILDQILSKCASWNNKTLRLKNQKMIVLEDDSEADAIEMNINALSALVFGYKKPTEMLNIGLIDGHPDHVKRLEELIPDIKPFLYDYF